MPKGTAYASADLVQLVAQANRRIAQEAKRQAAGGPEATNAGAVALHYAQRELTAIYGFNSGVEKLSVKGVSDPETLRQIEEAATRIVESKMLTVSGRKEAEQKAAASFFGVPRGKLTAKQQKIYKGLMEGKNGAPPLIEKLKESAAGYAAGSIKDAVQMMVENGLTGNQITETLKGFIEANAGATVSDSIYDYLADKYPEMDWMKE